MRRATITPIQDLAITRRNPNWFNASAVSVLLPQSNVRVGQSINRRERRASMKGVQR